MNKQRELIEIDKIIQKYIDQGGSIDIRYENNYIRYWINEVHQGSFKKEEFYDVLITQYYKDFHPDRTESIPLDLDEDVLNKLYEQADKSGMIVDEYLFDIIELYVSEMKDLDEEIKLKEQELQELKEKRYGKSDSFDDYFRFTGCDHRNCKL